MGETVRLGWRQYRLERKMFWRNPAAAFFNFMLPLLFLGLFGAIFSGDQEQLNVIIPGIAGLSVMSTTFSALAHNVVFLREQGVLKRMRGTPLPEGSYLAGIFGHVITNVAIQVTIVILAGKLLFGIDWPQDWVELIVFVAAGVTCLAALGIAFAHVIPNFDAAPAYVNIIFLPMMFISGVFFDADNAPEFLHTIGQIFPLYHLIEGLSGAMVTGKGLADNLGPLAVVAAWAVFGIFFAIRGFSWESRGT
ncbi:MAG TPA: ABC transporter permease [Baekduia sp.]|nr:ABC transporter permease [Baekduia sp.]